MTESGLWNVEWPNVNASRKYPLSLDATLRDSSGSFQLPTDLVVDLVIPVHTSMTPAVDFTKFHVSQVGIFSAGVVISFAYDGTVFATVNVAESTFEPYSTYAINGTGEFSDSTGWVTIGGLEDTLKSAGAWSFDVNGARLHPTTIRPDIRNVTSLVVIDDTGESRALSGDIVLTAGNNFKLRVELKEDYADRTRDRIVFDAIDGSNMTQDCECNNVDYEAPCIRTINGVSAGDSGNVSIQPGSTCIEVTTEGNTITIADTCSEPCCDCRELDIVITAMETVANQIVEIEQAAQQLEAQVSATRINLLASRTNGLPS